MPVFPFLGDIRCPSGPWGLLGTVLPSNWRRWTRRVVPRNPATPPNPQWTPFCRGETPANLAGMSIQVRAVCLFCVNSQSWKWQICAGVFSRWQPQLEIDSTGVKVTTRLSLIYRRIHDLRMPRACGGLRPLVVFLQKHSRGRHEGTCPQISSRSLTGGSQDYW